MTKLNERNGSRSLRHRQGRRERDEVTATLPFMSFCTMEKADDPSKSKCRTLANVATAEGKGYRIF